MIRVYLPCKAIAGDEVHIRQVGEEGPNYSGFLDRPPAFCGAAVDRDCETQVKMANCEKCKEAFKKIANASHIFEKTSETSNHA